MIIKLTPAEVKGYISVALNLNPSRFDIEIVSPDQSILAAFCAAIQDFPLHASIQKIPAIKRFRELAPRHLDRDGFSSCSVGLADAKWAVENALVARMNLERAGSIRG